MRLALAILACAMGLWIGGIPSPASADAECVHGDQNSAMTAIVDKINARGLQEAHEPTEGPWVGTFGPVAEWYTDYVARLGGKTPPTDAEQRGLRMLTDCLASGTGVRIATGIWLNATDAAYSDARIRAGAAAIEAAVNESRATPDIDAELDRAMADWITARSRGAVSNAAGFVHGVRGYTRNVHPRTNPFRTVTFMTFSTKLDDEVIYEATGPAMNQFWYYEDKGVQGVRLDGAPGMSLYVFVGEDEPIAKMCMGLNLQNWSAVKAQFDLRNIFLQPIGLDFGGSARFQMSELLAYDTLLASAVRQAAITLDRDRLALFVLTGVSGLKDIQRGGPLVTPAAAPASLTTQRPMLYVVEDKATGVILFIGSQLTHHVSI